MDETEKRFSDTLQEISNALTSSKEAKTAQAQVRNAAKAAIPRWKKKKAKMSERLEGLKGLAASLPGSLGAGFMADLGAEMAYRGTEWAILHLFDALEEHVPCLKGIQAEVADASEDAAE